MSDTILRDLVLKRLDAETKPEDEWSALVLAALEDPDELSFAEGLELLLAGDTYLRFELSQMHGRAGHRTV